MNSTPQLKTLFLLGLLSFELLAQSLTIDAGSQADRYFTGGSVFPISTPGATGDLTLRVSPSYRIPVAPGMYTVQIYLRESGTIAAPGQRSFTVRVQGQDTNLAKFDLFATAGLDQIRRDFIAVSNGWIDVSAVTHAIPGVSPVRGAIIAAITVAPFIAVQAGGAIPTGGPGIIVSQSPYTISVDTGYLNTLYPQLATTNIYSPSQRFMPSATAAGIEIVCSNIPKPMRAGSLFCNLPGQLGYFDGKQSWKVQLVNW